MKHLKLFNSFVNEDLNEKEFSTEEREKLADKGYALPDGSFPIATVDDLKNAVHAFGRANDEDRKKVAQHIAKRAKALGQEDLIPQTDIFQKALNEAADTGERIRNLNAKISAMRDKLTAAKTSEEKNKIQSRIKDAMQTLSDIKKEHSIHEGKQEHIKYLQDFITRWDDAQEKDQDLKGLETEYNKKLTQFGLPKMSADELLHHLQGKTELSKVDEGVVSIKGGRILAHKVLNKLVDMDVIPVKKKTEELVEAIASLLASASLDESLNEANYEVHFSDGIRQSKGFNTEPQAIAFAKELLKNKNRVHFVDVYKTGPGFHSLTQLDNVVAWWGDGSYLDNKSKNDSKLAAKRIDEAELNEAAVKKFESDIDSVVKDIKAGYGWIDPEYIEETWDNIATSINFAFAPEEICNRLIKAGLVYFPDNKDGEAKGKQVKNYSEISKLVESLNEGMVQIAGKNKPSGAKVLATIIVDDLIGKDYMKPGADKVKSHLVDDVQNVIMNNTF